MSEKELKVRMVQKHDIEANWDDTTDFIPKAAEVIVYDKDESHDYVRFKIGDGEKDVKSLPFINVFKINEDGILSL